MAETGSFDFIQSNGQGDEKDPFQEEEEEEEEEETDEEDKERAALAEAFNQKVRPYIDLVDELRRYGLEQDIRLPSAVVIGDQSSGKSSILEAISGVQLPRGSGIVTRCPLELQMKKTFSRGEPWSAELRYHARSLGPQVKTVDNPNSIEDLIRQAQNEIAGKNKGISDQLITLRIESFNCPDVTLIDLPGIARTPVGDQPSDICTQIKNLLTKYIEEENTIILCVIPSNVDIAVNEALSMAKEVDPDGCRTLGVLTKPDLVDKGNEADVLAILDNERFFLKKGYNIVKCRGQQDILNQTQLASALIQEEEFFKNHRIFRQVNPEVRGTANLALKLTHTLVDHIKRTLPKLREEVRIKLEDARMKLKQYGVGPPTEEGQKRLFLMKLVDKFIQRVERIFKEGDRVPGRVFPNPVVIGANRSDEYNSCFLWRKRFQDLKESVEKTTKLHLDREELSVRKIEEKMERYRGRELPCFLNIELFEKLVQEHVKRYKEAIDECCKKTSADVEAVVSYALDEELSHLPNVKGRFRGLSETTREECRENSVEQLEFEMEKELLVFSQDQTFFKQLKQLAEKLKNQMNKKNSNRDGSKTDDVDFFSITISQQKDAKKNAEVMQKLIAVYLKVANRRVLDNVPMVLRCKQHLNFVERLREKLQMLCAGEEVSSLVQEELELVTKRRNAQARADRLSHAVSKLNCIA